MSDTPCQQNYQRCDLFRRTHPGIADHICHECDEHGLFPSVWSHPLSGVTFNRDPWTGTEIPGTRRPRTAPRPRSPRRPRTTQEEEQPASRTIRITGHEAWLPAWARGSHDIHSIEFDPDLGPLLVADARASDGGVTWLTWDQRAVRKTKPIMWHPNR